MQIPLPACSGGAEKHSAGSARRVVAVEPW